MSDEIAWAVVNLFVAGIRLYAALLLVGAAIGKLRHPEDSARAVSAYRVLPPGLVGPLAAALPFVELAAGLGAALVPHPACAGIAAGLFAMFAAAIGVNLLRGRRSLECGCGFGARRIGPALLVHNLVLAALLLASAGQRMAMMPLSILFGLIWAGAMLALLLSLDTLNSIETPTGGHKAR